MRITFNGAAGEVTGSCHLLDTGSNRILLDCGMIQGSREAEARNRDPFLFDPAGLDAVVLSHAHIDHCGRLPLLVQRGYRGPIWTHTATADLLGIMLEDSAALAEADAQRNARRGRGRKNVEPLYSQEDVARTLERVRALSYQQPHEILPGVVLTLRDAGHILGSASVEIRATEEGQARTLVFSGDVGPLNTPILCDPDPVPEADLVLLESTYGGRTHRSRTDTVAELGQVFEAAALNGGNVIIPAFAVGRSQELLYWFGKYFDEWNLARFNIFLDSPMAQKVVAVYGRHEDLFDSEAKQLWRGQRNPLKLPNLRFTVTANESRAINDERNAIVIAGSGMCNGGRIRHHLRHNLGKPQAHVVFVGFQAEGTLGRRLVDGAKSVRIFGEEIEVKATRHTVGGLSAHADQPGLLNWYGAIKNRPPVFLVHGEDPAREALAQGLRERFGCAVGLPHPGEFHDVAGM